MEATIEVSGVRKRFGRTVPETIWLLAATMVLTVAVSTAATAATRCAAGIARPVSGRFLLSMRDA
jgi:hypothetical protein